MLRWRSFCFTLFSCLNFFALTYWLFICRLCFLSVFVQISCFYIKIETYRCKFYYFMFWCIIFLDFIKTDTLPATPCRNRLAKGVWNRQYALQGKLDVRQVLFDAFPLIFCYFMSSICFTIRRHNLAFVSIYLWRNALNPLEKFKKILYIGIAYHLGNLIDAKICIR